MARQDRGAWCGGHKVLACARRMLTTGPDSEPDRDFQFLGLLAFEDPVRAGVREAVAKAQGAGIKVIMVTGDHVTTATAIAREIGLGGGTRGSLRDRSSKPRRGRPKRFDVVARAIPSQKLDLVRCCAPQARSSLVTGDGVNDVPALQGADIGIAMGSAARALRARSLPSCFSMTISAPSSAQSPKVVSCSAISSSASPTC